MARNHLGLSLLIIATILSSCVIGFIVYVHFGLLINGKGIGSFSVLFYIFFGGIATCVWLPSFMIYPNTKLHFLFWLINTLPAFLIWLSPMAFSV